MRAIVPLTLATVLLAASVSADDQSDCLSGVEMIKTEVAKDPAAPVLAQLRTSLRIAERERGEAEWDECVDAVKDAKKALGR